MIVQTINIAQRLVKQIIANYDSANYTHWPKVGPTNDSQRIQAANDSTDCTLWPNVGPADDSQRIQAAYDSADYIHWPNVGPTDLANVFYTSSDSLDNISWPNVGSTLYNQPQPKANRTTHCLRWANVSMLTGRTWPLGRDLGENLRFRLLYLIVGV